MELTTAKALFADLIDEYLSEQGSLDRLDAKFHELKKELPHVPPDKDLDRAFESCNITSQTLTSVKRMRFMVKPTVKIKEKVFVRRSVV